MARIQHIAIMAKDTHKVAEFYCKTFEMREVSRQDTPNGAVHLSDGNIDLAILPAESEHGMFPEGLNHIGFNVEDVEAAAERAKTSGGLNVKGRDRGEVPAGRAAETYVKDPVGGRVDMSKAGWKT